MNQPAALIMFDGPDGVGKTTQFELVAKQLKSEGYEVFEAHMLGGTEIGEALRKIMFSDAPRPPLTNLYIALAIYYALAEETSKQRAAGKIVLIDRSPLSLVAYQVYGDGLDETVGLQACEKALQAFQPDKLIIYEAPLEALQSRRQEQQEHKAGDYFENQALEYHQRTTEGYRRVATHYSLEAIDADADVQTIHERTMAQISPLLAAE